MGRSRGGLTTKIYAFTDAQGLPITLKQTAGQALDGRSADDMLSTIGPGQTRLADAAYDSTRLRDHRKRRPRPIDLSCS
jgi:transposase